MQEDNGKEEPIRWYVKQEGKLLGPFSSSAVRRSLLLGQVGLNDMISTDAESWRPLVSVAEVVPPQLRRAGHGDAAQGHTPAAPAKEKRPFLSLLLSIVLMVALIGYGLYRGPSPESAAPDCAAPPGPDVNWRNCRLEGIRVPSADLRRADMYSALLRGAGLSGAILTDANLEYADLSGADLSYALLGGAKMKGANLQNADLTNADLSAADLSFADLRGAAPGGVVVGGARLDHAIWFDGGKCLPGSVGTCVKSAP